MHVLATWELGRGYGHLGILARVARALRAQGHRVTYAARYTESVQATCARDFDTVLSAPRYHGQFRFGETVTYAQVIAAGGFAACETLQPLVRRWLELFEQHKPDVLLAEHAPVSLLAARLAGVPARRIGSAFIAPEAADLTTSLLPWRTFPNPLLEHWATVCDPAIRATSAGKVQGLGDLLGAAPRFATTWPELDHFASSVPAESFYGDLGGLPGRGQAPDWPDGGGPHVLVYLPPDSQPGLNLRAALRRLRWPALWHWPGVAGSEADGAIRFVPEPIDLAAAAGTARLFVGRAGHGASALMMRAGVAQLLVPDTLESLLLAYRLRCGRLAITRPGDALPGTYEKALVRLASGELDSALRRVVQKYVGYDPDAAAARIADEIGNPAKNGDFSPSCTSVGR